MKWKNVDQELPPHDVVVDTKIDDDQGIRNETRLRRRNGLWFFEDNSMYVYYEPTHWKEISPNPKITQHSNNSNDKQD